MNKVRLTASTANATEIWRYTQGECHVFAAALHRLSGWPIHVILDNSEPYWVDMSDDDNRISSVIHVLCIDDEGRAWDVKGSRPVDDLFEEMNDLWPIGEYSSDQCYDEEQLAVYVGCWGEDPDGNEIDRPLDSYDEDDIAQATDLVKRVLVDLPGFSCEPEKPSPVPGG